MLSITVLFRDITRRFPKTGKWLLGIFLGVCLVMFVAYFPYASGTLTPTWWLISWNSSCGFTTNTISK